MTRELLQKTIWNFELFLCFSNPVLNKKKNINVRENFYRESMSLSWVTINYIFPRSAFDVCFRIPEAIANLWKLKSKTGWIMVHYQCADHVLTKVLVFASNDFLFSVVGFCHLQLMSRLRHLSRWGCCSMMKRIHRAC